MEKALELEGELCSERGTDLLLNSILTDFRRFVAAGESITWFIVKLVAREKSKLFLFIASPDN